MLSLQKTQWAPSVLESHGILPFSARVPNFFGGVQSRRTGVGMTIVFNSLILRGWVTKVSTKNRGGGRVGDNNIFDFFYATGSTRNATLKNYILGNFFYSYL